MILAHYTEKDIDVYKKLEYMESTTVDTDALRKNPDVKEYEVFYPKDGYRFLHEAAIIEFKGRLFASWYSCPKEELRGITPIIERRSSDGGKHWSEPEIVCNDENGEILYCPPIYHIEDGKLYMLINEMVKADHMHALDLFVLNEETDKFEFVWSRPIPFKINTNVCRMDNGKLLIPGRAGESDKFPFDPAVLISDSGKIDGEYRLVKIQDIMSIHGDVRIDDHYETSAILDKNKIYLYCRNDRNKVPLLYISEDYGDTWSKPIAHNIPFSNSKIYCGTLEDGRNYIIGNTFPNRTKLVILFTNPGEYVFTSGFWLQDGFSEQLGYGGKQWSYPFAYEADEKLYVIYSADSADGRGAVLSVIDLKN